MARDRMERSTWSTGPEKFGGREYHEVRVRDKRNKVVAYALCETKKEADEAAAEFGKDFVVKPC